MACMCAYMFVCVCCNSTYPSEGYYYGPLGIGPFCGFLILYTSGRQPGESVPLVLRGNISIKTKHRNRLNLELALILALNEDSSLI
jgi:hypothetical protein